MGFKHYDKIVDFLKANPGTAFARTVFRDELNINWNTVTNVLDRLLTEDKISIELDPNGFEKYQWRGDEIEPNKKIF